MVEPIDGRHDDSIQHDQKGGPCSCTQGLVANGVCVEKSWAGELRVFAQTTHTYYKSVYVSDRFFQRLHEAYHFPRTEHRAAPLQLKHCRCMWSPSFIFASSVKKTG